MGELLCEFCDIIEDGEHSRAVPTYYSIVADFIAQARISDIITSNNWRNITNRMIYQSYADKFPTPTISVVPGYRIDCIWRKLCLPVLTSESRELLFLLVHNKLPVRERLFRIGLVEDPYCQNCFYSFGAIFCDLVHFFCECTHVLDAWAVVKDAIVHLDPSMVVLSNAEFLSLQLPKSKMENEIVWLIATYATEIWRIRCLKHEVGVNKDKLFGFLRFKYRSDQVGARYKLQIIPFLNT